MEILRLRTAIRDVLRAALPGVSVEEFPRASMDTADLDLALKDRSLALRVAFRGIEADATFSANEVDAPESWAVFIAAKDQTGETRLSRDQLILGVIPQVLRAVAPGTWFGESLDEDDDDCAHKLTRLRAVPAYEGETDTRGAALWAVTWQQTVSIPPVADGDIRPFLTLVTSYDLAPADEVIDASDTITLEQE